MADYSLPLVNTRSCRSRVSLSWSPHLFGSGSQRMHGVAFISIFLFFCVDYHSDQVFGIAKTLSITVSLTIHESLPQITLKCDYVGCLLGHCQIDCSIRRYHITLKGWLLNLEWFWFILATSYWGPGEMELIWPNHLSWDTNTITNIFFSASKMKK